MKHLKRILGNRSGIALITVILILSILVAAALELNRSSRSDIYQAANTGDGLKLIYIAKSGFYAAAALLADSKGEYETLRDDWAQAEVLSAQSKTLFDNGSFAVRIEDEKGKIPLNKLVAGGTVNDNIREVLLRLLKQKEFGLEEAKAAEIVDAIIDWMDENEDITGMGAESSYYSSLSVPYAAKNAPLDCIEELLMVKGMTNELFGGTSKTPALAQFLTIYGTGVISINTAPKMVLRSLSPEITDELTDRMDEYRKNTNHDLSSANWYKNVSGMGGVTIQADLIDVAKSNYFRIYSTGVSDKMRQNIVGVLQRSPLKIMSWRQD
jgi:general secretion pathway protein K